MKFLRALAMVFAFFVVAKAETVTLFDGQTLDGWRKLGGPATYEVEDGAIVGTYVETSENTFLATEAEYGDFVLDLDFKIDPDVNSGIQFRSHSTPDYKNGRVHGYQAEIDPADPRKMGGVYDEARRGWIHDVRDTDIGTTAAKAFKPDDWNHLRVEAIGDRIRTWLNDVPISDFRDDRDASGFIALQVHSVPAKFAGRKVRWKNLKLEDKSSQ